MSCRWGVVGGTGRIPGGMIDFLYRSLKGDRRVGHYWVYGDNCGVTLAEVLDQPVNSIGFFYC